jgi:hypothetical protein
MSNPVTSESADTTEPTNLEYVVTGQSTSNGPAFVACFSGTAVVTDEHDHTHTGHTAISAWYGADYFTAIQSHIEGHEIEWVDGKTYQLAVDLDAGQSLTVTAVMVSTALSSKIQTMTLSGIAAG